MSVFSSVVGAVAGPLVGGALSLVGGNSANSANKQMAREQMDFQADMSNTSYQRAAADMKLAGLNPMLAYSQGGASSPSGSTAQMQNALGSAVSSAMQYRQMNAELDNLRSQNANIKSQTALNEALKVSAKKDAELKSTSARVANANANLLQSQLPGLRNEAEIDNTKFGKVMRYLGRLNPFTSNAAALKSLLK